MLQNCAILDRRYLKFDAALKKLYKAQEIDPTFCQSDHWIGITLINKGDVKEGLHMLKKSLQCKFSVSNSLQSLHKLFEMLFQMNPGDPVYIYEWGSILHSAQIMYEKYGEAHSGNPTEVQVE